MGELDPVKFWQTYSLNCAFILDTSARLLHTAPKWDPLTTTSNPGVELGRLSMVITPVG